MKQTTYILARPSWRLRVVYMIVLAPTDIPLTELLPLEPSGSPEAPFNSLTGAMHTDGALYTPTLVDCLVCSWTVLDPTQRITIGLPQYRSGTRLERSPRRVSGTNRPFALCGVASTCH